HGAPIPECLHCGRSAPVGRSRAAAPHAANPARAVRVARLQIEAPATAGVFSLGAGEYLRLGKGKAGMIGRLECQNLARCLALGLSNPRTSSILTSVHWKPIRFCRINKRMREW